MNRITLDAEQYMESELADHNFALLGFTSWTSNAQFKRKAISFFSLCKKFNILTIGKFFLFCIAWNYKHEGELGQFELLCKPEGIMLRTFQNPSPISFHMWLGKNRKNWFPFLITVTLVISKIPRTSQIFNLFVYTRTSSTRNPSGCFAYSEVNMSCRSEFFEIF